MTAAAALVAAFALAASTPVATAQAAAQAAGRADDALGVPVAAVLAEASRLELAGRYAEAGERLCAALRRAPTSPDAARLGSAYARLQGQRVFFTDAPTAQARPVATRALAAAGAAGESLAAATASETLAWLDLVDAMRGGRANWDAVGRTLDAVRALRQRRADTAGVAWTLFYRGLAEELRERPDSALAWYRLGLTLAEPAGPALEASYFRRHVGAVLGERGARDSALAYQERSLALRRRVGFPVGEVFALGAVGDAQVALGRLDAAEATYREATRLARTLPWTIASDAADEGLAALLARRGRPAATRARRPGARPAPGCTA